MLQPCIRRRKDKNTTFVCCFHFSAINQWLTILSTIRWCIFLSSKHDLSFCRLVELRFFYWLQTSYFWGTLGNTGRGIFKNFGLAPNFVKLAPKQSKVLQVSLSYGSLYHICYSWSQISILNWVTEQANFQTFTAQTKFWFWSRVKHVCYVLNVTHCQDVLDFLNRYTLLDCGLPELRFP